MAIGSPWGTTGAWAVPTVPYPLQHLAQRAQVQPAGTAVTSFQTQSQVPPHSKLENALFRHCSAGKGDTQVFSFSFK